VVAPPPSSCAYAGAATSAARSSTTAIANARNKLFEDAAFRALVGPGP
jgi:hypothetical protein